MNRTALAAAVLVTVASLFAAQAAEPPTGLAREGVQQPATDNPNAGATKAKTIAKDAKTADAVTENNADFHTVAQPNWPAPKPDEKTPVQIALKVVNPGPKGMQLCVFDTIRVVVKDAAGKELAYMYARDATRFLEPLIIGNKSSAVIFRDATLERTGNNTFKLTGQDGTGGIWSVEGLKPGKYTVNLTCEVTAETVKRAEARPAKHAIDPRNAPYWIGKVATKEISVEIGAAVAAR